MRFPNFRSPTTTGTRDVIEAFEDVFGFLRSLVPVAIKRRTGQPFAPPFFMDNNGLQPEGVILIRAKVSKEPTYPAAGTVGWRWNSQQIQIDAIPGLTTGVVYDLTFLIIG